MTKEHSNSTHKSTHVHGKTAAPKTANCHWYGDMATLVDHRVKLQRS